MSRLVGGTHFLVLSRVSDETGATSIKLRSFARFDEAISSWSDGSRISPIFALDGAIPPNFSTKKKQWLFMLGPKFPGDVPFERFKATYLSLGLYNILLVCATASQRTTARSLAGSSCAWEEWEISSNEILNVDWAASCNEPTQSLPQLNQKLPIESAETTPTEREYRTLVTQTYARSRRFYCEISNEIALFDSYFKECMEQLGNDEIHKHGETVNVNAILSRRVSQLFSGVTPILLNPCHYQTHSLFGIGIAILALTSIESYISSVFGNAHISERLLYLKNTPPQSDKPIFQLNRNHDFWNNDHLFDHHQEFVGKIEVPVPVLCCFSGRDGFKCTQFSLSSSLEVLTGCNTTQWTLQTLTHETSHRLIEAVLGLLVPKPQVSDEVNEVLALFDPNYQFKTLFEQMRFLLCFGFWQIATKNSSERITADKLSKIIRANTREVNETLTHIFDFLYHYKGNAEKYIRSLWLSWAVIPNIEHRIPEYVNRTLCAIFANHLSREHGVDICISEVKKCLTDTYRVHPDALYISDALSELETFGSLYKRNLINRIPLVKFVKHFLYSSKIEADLLKETIAVGAGGGVYPFSNGEFSTQRIGNPLRFITEFDQDKTSLTIRSVWMLQQLAFRTKSDSSHD